jgi:glycosyltransferase involved in cell wall biosynthesis
VRIAFDHQAFCLQKNGGISRYFYQLAKELACSEQVVGVFSPLHRNQYAQQLSQSVIHGQYVRDYPRHCARVAVELNGMLARRQLRAWRPDIVHETYFSKLRSGPLNSPTVLTMFDMISELGLDGLAPTNEQLRDSRKFAAAAHADHIICISEHARQDLIRLYDIAPEKTSVIHLGCEVPPHLTLVKQEIGRPYLLYVGLRKGYKNFSRFIQAVASSAEIQAHFDIVAFGGGVFSEEERKLLQTLKLTSQQVRHIDGDDRLLASYYSEASALVYPSRYEGFGLPPLEAMAYQCPVVSSHAAAMPEVLGDAAEFFDPTNLESIAKAIQNVVLSPQRTKELIQKGTERVKKFTWHSCAAKHLVLYKKLVGETLGNKVACHS